MGILNNGILGGFRNKVGTVIGRKFRDKDLIVGLYRESTKPEKEGEILQQNRFRMLNYFLNYLKSVVGPGFKQYAKKKSALNAAHSYNYGHAFIVEGGVLKLNFPKMVYSRGNVSIPNCPTVALSAPQQLTFTWLPEGENQFTRGSDKATFVVWMENNDKPLLILIDAAARSALGFSMEIPGNLGVETLHCYMSFRNASGKLVGNSFYVGAVEVV